MALNTTPAVPVHELHQFLLMGIQGQKKNRKIGALTYKSELAVSALHITTLDSGLSLYRLGRSAGARLELWKLPYPATA